MFTKIFCRIQRRKQLIKVKNFGFSSKITITLPRGHDKIISFIQIDGFREEHKRLLNKNFGFR